MSTHANMACSSQTRPAKRLHTLGCSHFEEAHPPVAANAGTWLTALLGTPAL